jgi:methionyl-tRNA formyltransferase
MKIQILTSRAIGDACADWAHDNLPKGWELSELTSFVDEDADVIISVLFDRILKPSEIKGKRVYNFHPGILPENAGSGNFSWSIMKGDKKAGITLHKIDEKVDHGDILAIRDFDILPDDTAESLFIAGTSHIQRMFKDYFVKILKKKYKISKQDMSLRKIYSKKDLDKMKDLTPIVRALTFTGKDRAFFTTRSGRRIELDFNDGVI